MTISLQNNLNIYYFYLLNKQKNGMITYNKNHQEPVENK